MSSPDGAGAGPWKRPLGVRGSLIVQQLSWRQVSQLAERNRQVGKLAATTRRPVPEPGPDPPRYPGSAVSGTLGPLFFSSLVSRETGVRWALTTHQVLAARRAGTSNNASAPPGADCSVPVVAGAESPAVSDSACALADAVAMGRMGSAAYSDNCSPAAVAGAASLTCSAYARRSAVASPASEPDGATGAGAPASARSRFPCEPAAAAEAVDAGGAAEETWTPGADGPGLPLLPPLPDTRMDQKLSVLAPAPSGLAPKEADLP